MDLPFTNIRQVLSLHNKVSPEKIFLTTISDTGREELSYAEFSARCHQTANFLQEDLGIKPGETVTIIDNRPGDFPVLLMGCWLIGALVSRSIDNRTKVCLLRDDNADMYKLMVETLDYVGAQLVQLDGSHTSNSDFYTLVRGMPNTFFNEYPEPTVDTLAYLSQSYDKAEEEQVVSQGLLLDTAERLTNAQMITGNQRLLTYMELGSRTYTNPVTLNTMALFIAALLVGGSLIIDRRFYPHAQPEIFWREVAASRLHIACISIEHIPKLINFAREQQAAGKPIYGEGVYQQDIQQLRHIYCPDAKGQENLIKQFTDIFPFPVVTNNG
ncbi:MAG: AMP-binding protein [Anaerolineae bacterium]|nr:AMP-binding protein [Anaerolineae bacterium]